MPQPMGRNMLVDMKLGYRQLATTRKRIGLVQRWVQPARGSDATEIKAADRGLGCNRSFVDCTRLSFVCHSRLFKSRASQFPMR